MNWQNKTLLVIVYLNNVNIYFITHFAKFNFFRKNCLRDKASVVKYPHKIENIIAVNKIFNCSLSKYEKAFIRYIKKTMGI